MKDQIISWIQGPRNYHQGVAIYYQYGHNNILKQRFNRSKNETTESLLFTELCRLANISENAANALPRKAKSKTIIIASQAQSEYMDDSLLSLMQKLGIDSASLESEGTPENITNADDLTKDAFEGARKVFSELPESSRKIIKMREEFPFLRDDNCPVEIKLLVHDMFNDYDKYREAHKNLTEVPETAEIEELYTLAETAVESFLLNREAWDELEYYKANNEILGKHPIMLDYNKNKEIKELSDIDLTKKVNNVRGYIAKAKTTISEGESKQDATKIEAGNERLKKWTDELTLLLAELELRKK